MIIYQVHHLFFYGCTFSAGHCQYTISNIGTWKHHSANTMQIRVCLINLEKVEVIKRGEQPEEGKKISRVLRKVYWQCS